MIEPASEMTDQRLLRKLWDVSVGMYGVHGPGRGDASGLAAEWRRLDAEFCKRDWSRRFTPERVERLLAAMGAMRRSLAFIDIDSKRDIELRTPLRDFSAEYNQLMDASEICAASNPRTITDAGSDNQKPKKLLTSWREITEALEMKHSDQGKIKSLNERYEGPIPKPVRGGQPVVDRDILVNWWNSLATLQQELANQNSGKRLSSDTVGDMTPEIKGHVKARRSDRANKT